MAKLAQSYIFCNKKIWLVCLFFSVGSATANTYLTEGDLREEIPVVYGINHFIQPIEKAPAAVSIIDRNLIAAVDAQSIDDILALVPGFSLQLTAQGGLARGYQVSSEPFARRMHVEVDGRPLSDSMLATALWDDLGIDLEEIERVEVIRGSNQPADGGNALLGTVNIITRTPLVASRARLSLRIDGDGYKRIGLNSARTLGIFDVQIWLQQRRKESLTHNESASFNIDDDYDLVGEGHRNPDSSDLSRVQFDQYQYDRSVGGKLLWSPNTYETIEVSAGLSESRRLEGRQQADYSWQQIAWHKRIQSGDEWHGFIFHNLNKIKVDSELATNEVSFLLSSPLRQDADQQVILGSDLSNSYHIIETFPVDESGWSERWDAELRRLWKSDSGWQWSLGAAATLDRTRSEHLTGENKTHERSSGRLFTTAEWRVNADWLLSGGGMLEWADDLSTVGSSRVGLNYTATEQHTFRVAAAVGARQPTLLEQRRQSFFLDEESQYIDLIAFSSSQIDVEKTRLFELGYHWRTTDRMVDMDVRWYKQWSSDIIVPAHLEGILSTTYDPGYLVSSEQFVYYDNRAELIQQGIEIDLTFRRGKRWLMHLALSYLDTKDRLKALFLDSPFDFSGDESAGSIDAAQGNARWNISALASYSVDDNWTLTSHLTWQDSMPCWLEPPGKSSGQLDLLAIYKHNRAADTYGWEMNVAVRNVGDRKPIGLDHLLGRRVVLTLEYKWP